MLKVVIEISEQRLNGFHEGRKMVGSQKTTKKGYKTELQGTEPKQKIPRGPDFG